MFSDPDDLRLLCLNLQWVTKSGEHIELLLLKETINKYFP